MVQKKGSKASSSYKPKALPAVGTDRVASLSKSQPKKAVAPVKKAAKPAKKASAPKKTKAAFGVEPITEGPYANSGPEGAKRLAKGAEKQPEGVKAVLTNPGSVSV